LNHIGVTLKLKLGIEGHDRLREEDGAGRI
jgi:hypothetical protein